MRCSPMPSRRCYVATGRLSCAELACCFFQKICATAPLVMIIAGCHSAPYNRVEVTDFRTDSPPQLSYQDFNESYYRINEDGLVDLVLRLQTRSPSDLTRKTVQILLVRSFWKPHPGRTFAHGSMINANLCYAIFRGNSGISYEGGGFFEYALARRNDVITGKLEGGDLQPLRQFGSDLNVFEWAAIEGRFRARRNDRRATRIINQIDHMLGQPPRIDSPHRNPDY